MKNSYIIIALFFISLITQAQKIKKGEVFISKNKVASINKIKEDGKKYYLIQDANGNNFCKAEETYYTSILFHSDKELPYRLFYDYKLKDSLIISKKNYWLSEKRTIEYLM
ncbi:MAG: hypothetical protein WA839_09930, partial [Flavobacteriaceae bacterium]